MTDPTGLTFGGFTYNGSSQMTRYTDRAGNPISLTYDGSGSLTSIITPNGGTPTPSAMRQPTRHQCRAVRCLGSVRRPGRIPQHHGHRPEPAWGSCRVGLLGPALSSHCCGWNDLVEPYVVACWICVRGR